MSHSKRRAPSRKPIDPIKWPAGRPDKPYPTFPLTPHVSGLWMKKIRGQIRYFGHWAKRVDGKLVRVEADGWKDALELYKAQADDLHAGRTPIIKGTGLTVKVLGDAFLTAKLRKVESGELGARMFADYREIAQLLADQFGKNRFVSDLTAGDFEKLRSQMAKRWGPIRLGNAITRVRSIFKYAIENNLTDTAIKYGSEFKKPGKAVLRKHRAQNGGRMLEAAECRRIIDAANVQLRAMVLLALNAGYGNTDCASLPLSSVANLEGGWLSFPRPKTGIERRAWLWPETVSALQAVIAERPTPVSDDAAKLVFVNSRGLPWVRITDASRTDSISVQFSSLLKAFGLHRDGFNFYALRHVHRTVSDAARDPVACDLIMGHSDASMAAHYRERVDDSRIRAVCEHVRNWLFGQPPVDSKPDAPAGADRPLTESPDAEPIESTEKPRLRLYAG